ncbi:hypothetical protein B1R32_10417 [Abditibacterium utsteinense]|uniref:Uncharacterized protein n=1 Tax=Abditibacterium utsteinense TaxID=1960156 RepID=A0A2S8SUQ7_9BACT|nr:hypothetical protein [Abditibacterium utsteinense]PQV64524.1 hypothetical protein B1R32_10417 [Abditibacterium utsteinense]
MNDQNELNRELSSPPTTWAVDKKAKRRFEVKGAIWGFLLGSAFMILVRYKFSTDAESGNFKIFFPLFMVAMCSLWGAMAGSAISKEHPKLRRVDIQLCVLFFFLQFAWFAGREWLLPRWTESEWMKESSRWLTSALLLLGWIAHRRVERKLKEQSSQNRL